MAGGCAQRPLHRAVQRVRARQERARRGDPVRCLGRRQERGPTRAGRGTDRRGISGSDRLHAEEPVDGTTQLGHGPGPFREDVDELGRQRAHWHRAGGELRPGCLVGRLLHRVVERRLQPLAGLRGEVVDDPADRDRGGIRLIGRDGALRHQGAGGGGVVPLRLPRHLGEASHHDGEHHDRGNEQDDRPGRRSTARAAAWPAWRHRHRKLQGNGRLYTARNEAPGVSPDVVSVLAVERHCTVGAIARTSTRLRCRSTSCRMSAITSSVRR